MAVYQTISDTGFVVGRFDPHGQVADDVTDSQVGMVSLSKAGMDTFLNELGTKINESKGWTGDKKPKGGGTKVADYRKKRMEKIALAQARRETKMPGHLMASHLMPKSTAGKVALATVPAALAIRYNQQASDAAQNVKARVAGGYKKTRDTRHYRPASPYYDDYLDKSSDFSAETIAILDAWISKAGGPITGNASWGQGLGPPSPTYVPPITYVDPTYKRPSKRKIRLAEYEAAGRGKVIDETTGKARQKTPSERAQRQGRLKEPLELRVRRGAKTAAPKIGEALLGPKPTAAGAARTGGALRSLGTHLGTNAAVYAPMAFGATSAGVAGLAARRQMKASKKAAIIEEAARKARNKKLAIAGAASLPLLALAANKKPVEKSDDFEAYMKEVEKGIISAISDARFIRRANRLGANIPPQMTFSEKVAANRASRKAANAQHRQNRVKFSQNVPTGAPAPNAPAPQAGPKGFWDNINEFAGNVGRTAEQGATHFANVRNTLTGGAPAAAVRKPATRMGLTTGQQLALGGAGAAGLYGGYKLRQPKPAPYQ